MKEEVLKPSKVLVHVGKPTHTHKCGHECDSPYCGDGVVEDNCENCGGPDYIARGREPWRGR